MTVIKDGTGTSSLAKVDSDNHLDTKAITEPLSTYRSREYGDYFIISLTATTLNSTNEHMMIYLRNDNKDKNIEIFYHAYGYNGGNTNRNRTMEFRTYRNPGAPIANYVALTVNNVNYTRTNISNVVAYKWNGIGDGMTMPAGTNTASQIVGQGLTQVQTEGIPILGYGQAIGYSLLAEEVGRVSIVVRFYMIEKQ